MIFNTPIFYLFFLAFFFFYAFVLLRRTPRIYLIAGAIERIQLRASDPRGLGGVLDGELEKLRFVGVQVDCRDLSGEPVRSRRGDR